MYIEEKTLEELENYLTQLETYIDQYIEATEELHDFRPDSVEEILKKLEIAKDQNESSRSKLEKCQKVLEKFVKDASYAREIYDLAQKDPSKEFIKESMKSRKKAEKSRQKLQKIMKKTQISTEKLRATFSGAVYQYNGLIHLYSKTEKRNQAQNRAQRYVPGQTKSQTSAHKQTQNNSQNGSQTQFHGQFQEFEDLGNRISKYVQNKVNGAVQKIKKISDLEPMFENIGDIFDNMGTSLDQMGNKLDKWGEKIEKEVEKSIKDFKEGK